MQDTRIRLRFMRFRQLLRLGAASYLLLATFACQRQPTTHESLGERRTPAPGTDAEPQARRFCEALHGKATQRRAECCQRLPERLYLDECVRFMTSSLRAGAVRIDHAALPSCESSLERAVSSCDRIAPGQAALPKECQDLLQAQLSAGQSCRSSLECQAPLHCEGSSLTGTGKCSPPAELGSSCGARVDALATYTGNTKQETLRPSCAEHCSLVTHRCEPRPAPGSACFASVNCASGQSCVAGTCRDVAVVERALAAPGEHCATDFDCAQGGCNLQTDGARRCGMKCSASLASLREPGPTPFQLPLGARRTSIR